MTDSKTRNADVKQIIQEFLMDFGFIIGIVIMTIGFILLLTHNSLIGIFTALSGIGLMMYSTGLKLA